MFKASAAELQASADDMNRWLVDGSLKAHISHRFPLDQAAQAHALQEQNTLQREGTLAGKIVQIRFLGPFIEVDVMHKA